jgi:arylsulfatase A-like enzyme
MVRTKRYKLVYNPSAVDELYDMVNDPYEMNNLIDDPSLKGVLKALFMKLFEFGAKEQDYMSAYHTVSHAEFGPAFALGK